jgi:hypothetical protein
MAFRLGQKVQCINGGKAWFRVGDDAPFAGPDKGQVLRIAGFDLDPRTGELYLAFSEFPGGGYFSESFRPLVRRKTDISVFRAMLTKVPKTARKRSQVPA